MRSSLAQQAHSDFGEEISSKERPGDLDRGHQEHRDVAKQNFLEPFERDTTKGNDLERRHESLDQQEMSVDNEQQCGGEQLVETSEDRRLVVEEGVERLTHGETTEEVDQRPGGLHGAKEQQGEKAEHDTRDDLHHDHAGERARVEGHL